MIIQKPSTEGHDNVSDHAVLECSFSWDGVITAGVYRSDILSRAGIDHMMATLEQLGSKIVTINVIKHTSVGPDHHTEPMLTINAGEQWFSALVAIKSELVEKGWIV